MGLGSATDPMVARKEGEQRAAIANAPAFGKMAVDYIAVMKPSWRSAKHADQRTYPEKAGSPAQIV